MAISGASKDRKRNGSSQQKIKAQNTMLLFNLIRKAGVTSRAALAEETGLSPTTVSTLVDELIMSKRVRETGLAESNVRGRKPILLELDSEGGCIATVEVVSNGYICSVYDLCLKKLGGEKILEPYTSVAVAEQIKRIMKAKRVPLYRLIGIHVVFPGIFDEETGKLQFSTVIPEPIMMESGLVPSLRKLFPHTKVLINNFTSILAFMEFSSADFTPGKRLVAINIEEGIAAGVVTGGAKNELGQCYSLEMGHIVVDRNGALCKCKNRGCLETVCSIAALFSTLNAKAGMELKYSDLFAAEINETAMQSVAERFINKDPMVMAIMRDYVYALCCGIISVINLFNVQVVRIGGAISALGEGFIDMIRETITTRFNLFSGTENVMIEASQNDKLSLRKAAVMMAMDEIFTNSQD